MAESDRSFELIGTVLERNIGWIAAAENKIPGLLAVDTAMLGVLAALVPGPRAWSPSEAVIASVAAVLLLASMGCLASALFPRIEGPKGSLVFFEGIAAREREDYVKTMLKGLTPEVLADLARQCHRNAEIARVKHHYVRWSVACLLLGVVPWLVSVGLLYARHRV